ncbi:hypothetical protein ACVRYP_07315 [Streptococcus rifensis]
MKKMLLFFYIPLLFVLAACGQTAKDEFLTRVESQQSQKQTSYDYKIKMDDVTSSDATGIATSFESFIGKQIDATISQDLEKGLATILLDLSAVNPSLSQVEVIYAGDNLYMNAATFTSLSGITTTALDGKYIDAQELLGQSMPEIPKLSDYTPNNQANAALYKELDEKKFTKDGDDVTLTLTLNDLIALVEKAAEKGDEETKKQAADIQEQLETATESLSPDSIFNITLDKKDNGKLLMDLFSAENKEDTIKISMTFTKKDYQEPMAPTAEDILTEEEFNTLMLEAYSGQ